MVREILVIKRDILFQDGHFEGFVSINDMNFLDIIQKNFEYKERNEVLEHDANFKQVIPYVWIIDPDTKKVFAYKRASDEKYQEKRLRNKWSCGIGGHIEKDIDGKEANPINSAMNRELREEVSIDEYPIPKIVGYVNYETDVESVHFGIVAIAETVENVRKGDDEIAECDFFRMEKIEEMLSDPDNQFEHYTKLSWPFVKKYLSNS